ncbi:MAG: hypothetical protein D3922_09960, partial [Candidatus Electrothrix sp. AR1]|nr:hypothetical protein [Candidatus Electrothrix sp. AR1]
MAWFRHWGNISGKEIVRGDVVRTLIYGGGAVGLGLAACLLKVGEQVDILARADTRRSLQEKGLSQIGIFGDYHAAPQNFGCFSNSNELSGPPYDSILVCTKSFDSPAVARDIADHPPIFHE